MESEEEHQPENRSYSSHPPLRLYEEEEADLHLQNAIHKLETPDKKPSLLDDPRIYIPLRFFKTIQGFHKGSLDLTGRHPSRYEAIMRRWNSFVSDMLDLSLHTTSEYMEPRWREESPLSSTGYKLPNENKWRQFREKWDLAEYSDFSSLSLHTKKTLAILCENPMPRFQQRCLTSLPVELLETIMGYASLDKARLLSSTCHFLRQIGVPFIFGHRSLCLQVEPDWSMLRAEPTIDQSEHLRNAAIASRNKLLKITEFLLSRPDLTQSLRTLSIHDEWSTEWVRGTLAEEFDVQSIPDFYAAIYCNLKKTLQASPNIMTLTLISMDIVPEFLQITARIPSLHTINFHMCRLDPKVCQSISENQIQSAEALLNLKLLVGDVGIDVSRMWHSLSLYPHIRTLLVYALGSTNISIPPDPVRHLCNPFVTLERVFLGHFHPDDVSALSMWMNEVSGNSFNTGLKLTHFKIQTRWGMNNADVFNLLDALQWSPNMRVLVLEGLEDAKLELIDRVAHACPNLHGLTLIRRQSDRQNETKLASWPHPSYEYASRFTAFTQLKHFGWNFDVETFGLDPTPSIMKNFEEGFPDPTTLEGWKETMKREDIAYFDDTHLMAGSFAVHCPTLRTFAIVDRIVRFVCRINKAPNGTILSKETGTSHELSAWNPGLSRNGWPPIEPPRIGIDRK